ncbi:MAG: hypothetical protein RL033_3575 [Pseudomonadota bacterium]
MNILIPCAHCDRYVRSQEASCPFCHGALAAPESSVEARPMARALVRSQSRAAAFALRAALVAPAALVASAALGCGGEEGNLERDGSQEVAVAGSGGSSASAGAGGSVGVGSVGVGGAGVGAGDSAPFIDLASDPNAAAGAGGTLAVSNDAADAGAGDAGFVPIPIYGGVFPDPVTRARV